MAVMKIRVGYVQTNPNEFEHPVEYVLETLNESGVVIAELRIQDIRILVSVLADPDQFREGDLVELTFDIQERVRWFVGNNNSLERYVRLPESVRDELYLRFMNSRY